MDEYSMNILIEKYLAGNASSEEICQVNTWYDLFDLNPGLLEEGSLHARQVMEDQLSRLKCRLGISPSRS